MENNLIVKELMEKIFASKRMQEYLIEKFDEFSDSRKSDIIGGSLLDIEEKLEYAKKFELKELENECVDAIRNMKNSDDEIFYLKRLSRNDVYELIEEENLLKLYGGKHKEAFSHMKEVTEILENITCCLNSPIVDNSKPFFSYDNILKYIDMEIDEEKEAWEDFSKKQYNERYYYVVEKWKRIEPEKTSYNKNAYLYGDMFLKCKYYIVNQKTVFFNKYENGKDYWKGTTFLGDSANLNIPIPFKGGDILHIDMKPFMNDINVFLLTKGDNHDCCSVQVLYIDDKGIFKQGALKHSDITSYHDWCHCVSPIYRITDEKPILKDKEIIFNDMAKELLDDMSYEEEREFVVKWSKVFFSINKI